MSRTNRHRFASAIAVLLLSIAILVSLEATSPGDEQEQAAGDLGVGLSAPMPMSGAADLTTPPGRTGQSIRTAVGPENAEPPGSGILNVHVRFAGDSAPVVALTMLLGSRGGDFLNGARRRPTDSSGTARFECLPSGRYHMCSDRLDAGVGFEMRAGETLDLDYELRSGLTVSGVVIDPMGVPVPAALIETVGYGMFDRDPEVVGRSDLSGKFVVRGISPTGLIGARAPGFTASPLQYAACRVGTVSDLRLTLGAQGGCVEGTVMDGDGRAIADARIIIGHGQATHIIAADAAATQLPPLPALVRSNEEGVFRAVGIPAGEQPVIVRARNFAPWQGSCPVGGNLVVHMRAVLSQGATVRGKVRSSNGTPVAAAEVVVGRWGDPAYCRTATASDGTFELRGLGDGEAAIEARHDTLGTARALLPTRSGATTACELILARGLELQGRAVDEGGQPVPRAHIVCTSDRDEPWRGFATTDATGSFTVANCPQFTNISVAVSRLGFISQRQPVDPVSGRLLITMQRTR